ncbi:alpha/beta fold hydrolase [Aeromonas dhakensis]|uniref:alpha/beta fold hydrolase n=1 Tax=Aeromonas dhakensis TaxID=196024 RepID=UPI0039B76DA0
MHKGTTTLCIVLSAVMLTACGENTSSPEKPTPKHVTANYNPGAVCATLMNEWDDELTISRDLVSCNYFQSPLTGGNQTFPNLDPSVNDRVSDKIDIFYMRVSASQERRGTLLYNPGGPGDATSGMATVLSRLGQIDPDILKYYDIVAFDPRGAGYSGLAHELRTCLLNDKTAVVPAMEPAAVAALFAKEYGEQEIKDDRSDEYNKTIIQKISSQCGHILNIYGPQFGANTIIQDMEQLRQHLAVEKITPLMISYGTRIASLYAHRYPEYVADIIIDSPMSAAVTGYLDVAKVDGVNANNIVAWRFGEEARQRSEQITNTIRDNKAYTDNVGNVITADSWDLIIKDAITDQVAGGAGEQQAFWYDDDASDLITKLREKENKNEEMTTIMESPMFAAIHCADNTAPYGWRDLDVEDGAFQGAGVYALHASFGVCADWAFPHNPIPSLKANDIHLGQGSIALVLGAEFDSQTPYNGVEDMRDAFGNSARVVKVLQSSQHGQIGMAECADQSIKTLLLGNKELIPQQQACLASDN